MEDTPLEKAFNYRYHKDSQRKRFLAGLFMRERLLLAIYQNGAVRDSQVMFTRSYLNMRMNSEKKAGNSAVYPGMGTEQVMDQHRPEHYLYPPGERGRMKGARQLRPRSKSHCLIIADLVDYDLLARW